MPGDGPPQRFLDELGEAFRRLQERGRPTWGFASSVARLDRVVRGRVRLDPPAPDELPRSAPAAAASSAGKRVHAALHAGAVRLTSPWAAHEARVAARQVVERALSGALDATEEGLGAALEALRFLAARVDALEGADGRRLRPVDGLAWLVPAPALDGWVEVVAAWTAAPDELAPGGPPGHVLVGECGDGALPLALAAAGRRVRAAEPRGALAAVAAQRGVDVHVGPVSELLASAAPSSVAGVVLAGIVDRASIDEVVELVALATDRLAAGAPLVVVSEGGAGWDDVALDLLPGRPLHAETWELLLRRSGCSGIETVRRTAAYAVMGRR